MKNDNRSYVYDTDSKTKRPEYEIISSWVDIKSNVIDLGCGDGSLLYNLIKRNKVNGVGIDVSDSAVREAKRKGVAAVRRRIDSKLPFKDTEFDYAISTVTLQMVSYPEVLLSEMKRISRRQIISFPNFAFILNRLDLLFNGRFPRYTLFGYEWFSTGHIHQFSISDFEDMVSNYKLRIVKRKPFVFNSLGVIPEILLGRFSNTWSTSAVFLLENE
jgi:methionine biosynthesis protein MetW